MNWFWDRLCEPLVIFGFAGQFVFMLRFIVQWFASERRRRSYVPLGFWYISIAGGVMLMIYGVLDHDPVIMLGQALGLLIYFRNLYLIYSRRVRFQRRRRVPAVRRADAVSSSLPEAGAAPLGEAASPTR
jgi:lipid-A-disaccharide synthase-like uncharacterized protein